MVGHAGAALASSGPFVGLAKGWRMGSSFYYFFDKTRDAFMPLVLL